MAIVKLLLVLVCMACIVHGGSHGRQYTSDSVSSDDSFMELKSIFGANRYVEYVRGTAPIILSVPHGGSMIPGHIGNRKKGSMVTDSNTIELGRSIQHHYRARYKATPHLVISHLKRTKMDPNRPVHRATSGHHSATLAYRQYHRYIAQAKHHVVRTHGKGVYIDLHGQNHAKKWVEVGYRINKRILNRGAKRVFSMRHKSSVNHLLNRVTSRVPHHMKAHAAWNALTGPKSLGAHLQRSGYRAVPSPRYRKPRKAAYFCGGYSIFRHGSHFHHPSSVDGIQIEVPRHIRMKKRKRKRFAKHFAKAVHKFHRTHYIL